MAKQARARILARLRAEIAALEKRPFLVEGARLVRRDGRPVPFGAPAGLVHEIFADALRDGAAALGFALGQALGLITPERRAVLYLALSAEGQETGLPYGPGLAGFGLNPEALVVVRTAEFKALLWAMEEALGCPAVAAVVADIARGHKSLDFTASRRLSLRAAAGGASLLLLRYGREREASAAQLRWRVEPAASAAAEFDHHALGRPRFALTLEKGVIAEGRAGDAFLLEWAENGFTPCETDRADAAGFGPALPGPPSAELGDRLPRAG